jgi:ATP-dependent Clp protease ATP-binding subunit ClpC
VPLPPFLDRALLALGLRPPTPAELAARLREIYDDSDSPQPLWEQPDFAAGVNLIARRLAAGEPIEPYVFSRGPIVALMAVEAAVLVADDERAIALLIASLARGWLWTKMRAVELIAHRAQVPVLVRVLSTIAPGPDHVLEACLPVLSALATARAEAEAGERFGDGFEALPPAQRAFIARLGERLAAVLPPGLVAEIRTRTRGSVQLEPLRSVGRVWEPLPEPDADLEAMPDPSAESTIRDLELRLAGEPPRSVLLSGESGTGKTALIRQLARRLQRAGWVIFEARGADLIAGQSYIGQLEARMHQLLAALEGRNVLWVMPSFHELAYTGVSVQDPSSVLDLLLPWLDRGAVRLIGETRPRQLERLLLRAPRVRTALSIAHVEPLDDRGTVRLAAHWCERAAAAGLPSCGEATRLEAAHLARQYLSEMAQPGALLRLLRLTSERVRVPGGASPASFGIDDIYTTLGQLTGLPQSLLDDRQQLALDGLRAHFEKRVLGQPEAVDRLVERVAMLKAGVTDPRRPLGVFLFVGPTGTGKTEIARTLAEFLFGSADRMIRLDMSEYQNPESLDSILGDRDPLADAQALVNRIRRQPFSVVLLDEFEKAHPRVWDLFLQVFDDGRLTDRRGDTADFRHAIVILTSNLGAAIPAGARLGFQNGSNEFAPGSVMRVIENTFRREFINRLDQIVVFRPLARSTMRDIVRRDLGDVFQRRGLRNRDWAVEWDDSAIDFLLEKGFTPDLGARPLRRAIEQYLLAPLATTIVRHEVPAGDQFLFVRAEGGEIRVRFVDPDATAEAPEEAAEEPHAPADLEVRDVVLEARGTPGEFALLREHLEALQARVAGEPWQARATATYAAMRADGFWRAPGRFGVLGLAENLDRVRAAMGTARSLADRLRGAQARERLPVEILRALAQQVYLLEAAIDALDAGETWEAFLAVRPLADADAQEAEAFAARLVRMYEGWAERRRMKLEVIDTGGHGRRWIAAVSGFAAWRLLRADHGLHVYEAEGEGERVDRRRVEVRIAPQPPEPASTTAALLEQATEALAASGDATAIVRRYRDGASPLVRDAVRGFRSGRVKRVFEGQFDVLR